VRALERKLTVLEDGADCTAFGTGMAAIQAVMLAFLNAGDHVVVSDVAYGGTYRLCTKVLSRFGVTFTFADTSSPDKVREALRANTRLIFTETPANPTLKLTDLAAVSAIARERGIPLLVDPKIPHIDYYAGASVVTPNHHEAEIATNMRVRTDEDARAAARAFLARSRCSAVLMTRGDQGVWLLGSGIEGALPASAREVADVTGAGDTVIATMALALAAGATLAESARLSNEAAGVAVGKFGPSVVTPAELLRALDASAQT
jgi:bifunctional ADP-heptose synthase (sugar kinase/adenylyltransferase)